NIGALTQWLSSQGLLNSAGYYGNSSGMTMASPPNVTSGPTVLFPGATVVSSAFPTLLLRPPVGLPGGWINYSCLDVICVSIDDLRRLADQKSPALKAIVEWTKLGGNLWVFGVGDDWSRLADLEVLLGLGTVIDA